MSHLITLHQGQLPIDVAGLHLIPGKAVPVEGEVPAEVLALRPRVRMSITRVHALPAPAEDGPERDGGPDTDNEDEHVEAPKRARAGRAG